MNRNHYDGWEFPEKGISSLPRDIEETYNRFNRKFFNSQLPMNVKIISRPHPDNPNALGFSEYNHGLKKYNDCFDNYKDYDYLPEGVGFSVIDNISICPHIWRCRAYLETVLLHEMCHIYQAHVLLEDDLSKFLIAYDDKEGHGDSFDEAIKMVNESSNNTEGGCYRYCSEQIIHIRLALFFAFIMCMEWLILFKPRTL